MIRSLIERGVKVNVLNVGLLDQTPMGKFFITTLLAVTELERSMILKRMQEGKAIARTKQGVREGGLRSIGRGRNMRLPCCERDVPIRRWLL